MMIIPPIAKIKRILQENRTSFTLCCHIDPDGDAIGSLLGLGLALADKGIKIEMLSPDGVPSNLRFLPGTDLVTCDIPSRDSVSTAIILDCADLNRVGPMAKYISLFANVINIDHHPTNTAFGTINWVEPEACATAEMVYFLLRSLEIPISKNTATCLYTGIHTDTGGFRYQNTSARVHFIAAKLVDLGAVPWWISEKIYDTKPLSQIRLLQASLERLKVTSDGRIAWITLPTELMDIHKEDDTSGIINYPRMVAGTELSILFKEDKKGLVKVSFRSKGLVDVGSLALSFGGGGHARAAGCLVSGPLPVVETEILASAKRALGSIGK